MPEITVWSGFLLLGERGRKEDTKRPFKAQKKSFFLLKRAGITVKCLRKALLRTKGKKKNLS